ncbi:MAG: hypothetical protein J6R91_03185 [Bacteroidaceae bacterium]|nr:hypothetical protein [Bacteroidaceae bacterium]
MSQLYTFECYPMPWADFDLKFKDVDNQAIVFSIELNDNDIRDIINMLHWAWDNEYFDFNNSDKKNTQLLKEKVPALYERVYHLLNLEFSKRYPGGCDIESYGGYEIFPPDEIINAAVECYSKRK